MTEQTPVGDRDHTGAPDNTDAIPPEQGSVTNGGAYMGGQSPDEATDDLVEDRAPLDSRAHFGGDGAQYVDPSIDTEKRPDAAQQARMNASAPGDDGYDDRAHPGVDQDAE